MDPDTPHRHQLSQLHSGFQVQALSGVFEDVQDALPIAPLRRGGEAQGKGGLEESQNLLVCIRRRVVRLVHDEVVKGVLPEAVQMQCHALYAATDNMGIRLLYALHVTPHDDAGPELLKGLRGLPG